MFQSMVSRFKKEIKVINLHLTKEDFLAEHNKLSGQNLQATVQLMARFEAEKPGICKNGNWCLEKVRRPFIMWLSSLNTKEIKSINRGNI